MAAAWSAWESDVSIDVPGCPAVSIEKAVRDTVIDFLERTHLIQRTVGPLDVTAGAGEKTDFGASIAADEHVLAIKAAWIDGKASDVIGPREAELDWPDWQTVLGTPQYIVMERPGAYYVVPALADAMTGALRFRIAVGLQESATSCDDRIRRDYKDTIAAGARARLMAMPEKPWTNLPLAGVRQAEYMQGVAAGTLAAIRTPARQRLATTPHFF